MRKVKGPTVLCVLVNGQSWHWVKPRVSDRTSSRKATFLSPCAHIDRTPEKALICHHYQVVPTYRPSITVLGRGSPCTQRSHNHLTRIMLRTENLWNWCHQVAQKAIVGDGATSTSFFSPLHLSILTSPSSFTMGLTSMLHRVARPLSLEVCKGCSEKTGL